jgi:hypothetical protein
MLASQDILSSSRGCCLDLAFQLLLLIKILIIKTRIDPRHNLPHFSLG